MPWRTTVWKPDSSSFTSYVPGTSDGKRYVPAASVTPFMAPDTRTGLLMVIVTPGTTPPCSSVAFTRMLPVCTCALADAATPDASNTNRRRTHRFMLPPEEVRRLYQTVGLDFSLIYALVPRESPYCPE